MTRTEEITAGLAAVRSRIQTACAAAGRDPAGVTLVAVSKTFPATDVRAAAALGVRDVGENRDQEARDKAATLADLPLTWHFIGQLQRNKCRSVARYAGVVHSLDRPEIVDALQAGAAAAGRRITALVQVSLDGESGRGGARPEDVPALADRIAGCGSLTLGGLMAVAPRGANPAPAFDRLATIAADLLRSHPAALIVSAGMSGDLEAALAAGATLVRVGTGVFGGRPPMLLR